MRDYFSSVKLATVFLLGLFLLPFAGKEVRATHVAGGDITYRCLGGGEYLVQASLYADCDPISVDPPGDIDLDLSSDSCNIDRDIQLDLDQANEACDAQSDATPFCNDIATQCGSGTAPGICQKTYTDTITIDSLCPDWRFEWRTCDRNGKAISTLQDSNSCLHAQTYMNNLDFSCNQSPQFNDAPLDYLCVDDTSCYNPGANDPDGDSLVYTLVCPTTGSGSNDTVTYKPGYDSVQFLQSNPPITIDTNTGEICMAPTQEDVSVMQLKIEEYRNDSLIGSVERDIQVRALDCSPYVSGGSKNYDPYLTGIDSTSNYSKTICQGDSVDFQVFSKDSNSTDSLNLDWNGGLQGGAFDTSGSYRPVGRVQWKGDSNDLGKNCFTVRVRDDNCPFDGSQVKTYCIYVSSKDSLAQATSFNYGSGTFCYDAPNQTPTIQGPTGGTFWADPAGLDIDPSTGEIDVGNSAADSSYMVYYQTPPTPSCQVTDSVPITIDSNQVADFHYPDTAYCETDSTTIPPTFLNNGTEGIFTYKGPGHLELDSIYGTVNIPASDSGTYTVYNKIPGSGSCPQDLDSATFFVEPRPLTEAGPNDTVCQGDSAYVDGSYWRGANAVTWFTTGDGTFQDPTDTITGYLPGSNDTTQGEVELVIQTDSIDACQVARDTMEVEILKPTSIDVGMDDTICEDEMLDLSANLGGSAKGIQWSTDGNGFFDDVKASQTNYHPESGIKDTTTVTLYGNTTGSQPCPPSEDSLKLTVIPLANPGFDYPKYRYCLSENDPVASIEGDTGGVFTADPPGGMDLDSNTGEIDLSESYADYYDVTYTVGERCPNDTTVSIKLNPNPGKPSPEPFSVCPGQTRTLSVDGDPDSVVWYSDDSGNNVLGTDSTYTPSPQNLEQPGQMMYYVKVYKNGCPSNIGSVTVTVDPFPTVDIATEPDPAIGVKPFEVLFKNASGTNVVDYDINFGNGTVDNKFVWDDTTVTYPKEGKYTVTMSGRDSLTGCSNEVKLTVEVVNEAQAQLPNVFTPNGDGTNDAFKPDLDRPCPEDEEKGQTCWNGIESFKGTIFNRWGNKVYQWTSWEDAWKGENASGGTYYFVIEALGDNGEQVEYKGQVTLLRKD